MARNAFGADRETISCRHHEASILLRIAG